MPVGFKGRLIRSTNRLNFGLMGRRRATIDIVARIGLDVILHEQRDNSLRCRRSQWRVAPG